MKTHNYVFHSLFIGQYSSVLSLIINTVSWSGCIVEFRVETDPGSSAGAMKLIMEGWCSLLCQVRE